LPEPLGVSVKLLFVPVVIVSVPLSAIWCAESVCVEAFMDRPLMVLVVFAVMMPPIERLFARVRLPALVRLFAPEKKLTLPVVPRVRLWPLVVPRTPDPVR